MRIFKNGFFGILIMAVGFTGGLSKDAEADIVLRSPTVIFECLAALDTVYLYNVQREMQEQCVVVGMGSCLRETRNVFLYDDNAAKNRAFRDARCQANILTGLDEKIRWILDRLPPKIDAQERHSETYKKRLKTLRESHSQIGCDGKELLDLYACQTETYRSVLTEAYWLAKRAKLKGYLE